MVSNCPNCGKSIKDENAVYCPHCSKPLKELPIKKTGLPIAGGILAIIVACASIIAGIIYILAFAASYGYLWDSPAYSFLLAGLFGIVAFALGLTGGIMSLRRTYFVLSIIGVCSILVSGFVNVMALLVHNNGAWVASLLFGFPLIVLSILSLIFIAVSKKEFT